jgi:hypothetical protein
MINRTRLAVHQSLNHFPKDFIHCLPLVRFLFNNISSPISRFIFFVSSGSMATPKTCPRPFFLLFIFVISYLSALSQSRAFDQMVFVNDSLNSNYPREKIFIHRDKPHYRLRDTMWLKGYILTAFENIPNDSSRFAFIEIINSENTVVKRVSTPCVMGFFSGSIILHETNFRQGQFLLRAYSRFMRNFGDSLFFESRFTIIDPASEEWKTTIHDLSFSANRLLVSARLNKPVTNRAIPVRLRSKNKTLFKTGIITDHAGNIHIDTVLKNDDTRDLQLEIGDLYIPVKAGEKRLIDLQFLPEGGSFIAGKLQRLGFKAVNISGKGIDVKGIIKDSKGTDITRFASIHKGMGIVSFTPKAGETYIAVLENGLSFTLPSAAISGISLQVIDQPVADSIKIRIEASPDLHGRPIYLNGSSKGITIVKGRIVLAAKGFELNLHRKELAPGITVFTLYDETLHPLNGRSVFTWHDNGLVLELTQHKPRYHKKDSVSLRLKVQNNKGKNVKGSFSMAVLDTSQVKIFGDAENLVSYMILSSDLKGEIEEPYYYFKQPAPDAVEALLLTQGWVSYNRVETPVAFQYEKDFTISGRVSNLFNKPLDGVRVTLFGKAGKTNAFLADTTANANGWFTFNHFPFYETDTISMVIKALNKKGKAFNVGIEIADPVYPPVNAVTRLYNMSGLLFDTVARQYVAKQEKINAEFKKGGGLLAEVIVKSKLRIPGSQNLNEDGGADQVVNEEILNKTPKESLRRVLEKQVTGFHLGAIRNRMCYMVNSNLVRIIIDGVNLNNFYQPVTGQNNEYVQFLDTYLNYFYAEDIKAIEVMNLPRHNSTYRSAYLTVGEQISSGPATRDFSFIEITTHSGAGPFLKKTPGMYLLKPLYPTLSKQFYSPRYKSPSDETTFPDLRNTVYWNPEIITDQNGEATVSFYTSESNGGYLIIVQGTDLKGNLGVLYQPLESGGK